MDTKRTSIPRPVIRGIAALLLAVLVVAGATACDPNAPADCTKDCVQFVASSPAGDTISISGTGAITSEVTIYRDAARTEVVGYARTFAPKMHAQGLPITKAYQGLPVEDPARVQLAPLTTYHYAVKATGALGKTWNETGTFKTRNRWVTFTVDRIWVYDDSDTTGSGELTFDLRVNGGAAKRVHQDLDWASEAPAVNPKFATKVTGVMPQVTMQIRGSDDDCEFSTCTVPSNQWGAVGGNGDTQWSTVTFALTAPTSGATGSYELSTTAGGLGDVGFWVEGTWSVVYETY